MRKVFLFSTIICLVLVSQSFASINLMDPYASEVLLNKAEISYNLALMKHADNVKIKDDVLIYRSQFDDRVAVMLEDVDDMGIVKGLSVRLQIPVVEKNGDIVPSIEIGKDGFDFNSAMKTELQWLKANGVVAGITETDMTDISILSKAGNSGWNSRIVYYEGRWFPYYEVADPNIIRIMEEVKVYDLDIPAGSVIFPTASVRPEGKSVTKWGKVKVSF